VTAASCIECHTAVDKGKIIEKLAFSGGREFNLPNGTVRSANITPDKETGIGLWTKESFVKRFAAFADSAYQIPVVKSNEFNTIMPWNMYGHMTTEDLEAIYTYLATLKPISNKVLKFSPALAGK
jgi:hypothetical protein